MVYDSMWGSVITIYTKGGQKFTGRVGAIEKETSPEATVTLECSACQITVLISQIEAIEKNW